MEGPSHSTAWKAWLASGNFVYEPRTKRGHFAPPAARCAAASSGRERSSPTTRKPASASGSECRPFPHPASRISAPGRHETRRSTSRASLADVARAFSTATVVRYRGSSKKRAAEIIFRSGGPYPGYALSHGAARGLAPSQLAQLLRRDEVRELRAARPEFLPRPFEIERRERRGWELALECVEPLSAGGQADRKLLERGVMADQQD